MRNLSNFSQQLRELSNYRALKIARAFLLAALLTLTLYVGYLGVSLIPFYLSVMLALLPSLIAGIFSKAKTHHTILPNVQRQIGYSKQKHLSLKVSLYLTLLLLLLWNYPYRQFTQAGIQFQYTPTLLIISTLVIYTIGQYYYFTKYHGLIMNNEINKIH